MSRAPGLTPASDRPPDEDAPDGPLLEAASQLRALIMAGERYRAAIVGATGLSTTESQAVGYLLVHGSRGQTDLARDLSLTSSAATAVVDRLERRGVAERVPHPSDRRRLLVRLTPTGGQVALRSQQPLLDTLSRVGRDELAALTSWLGVLADHLEASSC